MNVVRDLTLDWIIAEQDTVSGSSAMESIGRNFQYLMTF
jgi:hypothetical protein